MTTFVALILLACVWGGWAYILMGDQTPGRMR